MSRWRLNYAEFREALDLGRHKKAIGQTDAQLARAAIAQRERDRLAAAKAAGEAAAREELRQLEQMLLEGPPTRSDVPGGCPRPERPSIASLRHQGRLYDVDGGNAPSSRNEPSSTDDAPAGNDGEPVPLDDPRSDW